MTDGGQRGAFNHRSAVRHHVMGKSVRPHDRTSAAPKSEFIFNGLPTSSCLLSVANGHDRQLLRLRPLTDPNPFAEDGCDTNRNLCPYHMPPDQSENCLYWCKISLCAPSVAQ